MAGFRLAPLAARARRSPWQRKRLQFRAPPPPAYITGASASSAAAGSLSLSAPPGFTLSAGAGPANGTLGLAVSGALNLASAQSAASGSLDLTTTSAVGARAASGWLGYFILDTGGASSPLIAGGSNPVGSASLSLLTPSARLISGNSRGTATGSIIMVVGPGGGYLMGMTDGGFASFTTNGNFDSVDTTGDFLTIIPLPA